MTYKYVDTNARRNENILSVDFTFNGDVTPLGQWHQMKFHFHATTSGPKNVSNNLFVGSTAELQKFLKKGKDIKENKDE